MIQHLHEFQPMPDSQLPTPKVEALDLPELHVLSPLFDNGDWRGHCSCGWLSTSRATEREVLKLTCAVEAEVIDSAERMRRFRARQGH